MKSTKIPSEVEALEVFLYPKLCLAHSFFIFKSSEVLISHKKVVRNLNVLLAVNSKQLENYIGSLKEVNGLKCLKNSKSLAADIIALKPHVVVISRYLPGELDIKELNNFFIENNIFDFHVGDIDEEVITKLLFEPKKEKM